MVGGCGIFTIEVLGQDTRGSCIYFFNSWNDGLAFLRVNVVVNNVGMLE